MRDKEKVFGFTALAANLILGLILFASGSGKLIGVEGTPAQIVDFLVSILPDWLIGPGMMFFLFKILVPYIIPIAEFCFGIFLLIGFVPRFISTLSIVLILAFLGTNIWSITAGGYATCASCFGFWEKFLGHLTPVQSLIIDVVMLLFAVAGIVLHQGSYFSNRKRLSNVIENDIRPLFNRLSWWYESSDIAYFFRETRVKVIYPIILGCLALVFIAVSIWTLSVNGVLKEKDVSPISDIKIVEVTDSTAEILIETARPVLANAGLYKGEELLKTWESPDTGVAHSVKFDNLNPGETYKLKIEVREKIGDKPYILPSTLSVITASTPLTELPVKVTSINIAVESPSSVKISWQTSKPTVTYLQYWVVGSDKKDEYRVNVRSIDHEVSLSGLSPDNIYKVKIEASEGLDSADAVSIEKFFSTSVGIAKGNIAPDFSARVLDGDSVKLSDFRGRTVFMTFWMATCGACRHELPILADAEKKLAGEGIVFLNVHAGLRESVIKGFLLSENLQIKVLLDLERHILNMYGVTGVPSSFIIDKNGFIQEVEPFFEDADQLVEILKRYNN